jgi:hypothetical protein
MTKTTTDRAHRQSFVVGAIAALGAIAILAGPATAAGQKVRSACKDDYFRFCPSYEPDSAKMRQCMRAAGKRLSARCLDALADAGEIRRSKR